MAWGEAAIIWVAWSEDSGDGLGKAGDVDGVVVVVGGEDVVFVAASGTLGGA